MSDAGRAIDVVVIGGGQSGLAMSACLSQLSIDHVVIERGSVAHSWVTQRWDSLRLLTPNWMSHLPGAEFGGQPDEFAEVADLVEFLRQYCDLISAPLSVGTSVTSVRQIDGGFRVDTDQGSWNCRAVVLATGSYTVAKTPPFADSLPGSLDRLSALEYRNPDQLDDGGVLVVGASATGVQLADELLRSGRHVTIAVGNHVRMPRTYRERDIQWWMNESGVMDEAYDEVDDITRARKVPSAQLTGTPERRSLDLNSLVDDGARVVGRLGAIRDRTAQFSGGLRNQCTLADLKMNRLLDTIDEWADAHDLGGSTDAERFAPTEIGDPPMELDLTDGSIRTVLWANGFAPDHSWLDVDVVDHKGRVRHDGGVCPVPGLYLIGGPFLRRRKSSFLHGTDDDARDLTDHLFAYLSGHVGKGPDVTASA